MANEVAQQSFSMDLNPSQSASTVANTNASREMEEVKGQIFMAKQFPRNPFDAEKRILDACKRESLAKTATYSYPRGGQNVTGPSIRLAEVLAQNWGNISFGFKELDQDENESEAMAYAWDVETNTRQERIFKVPHFRSTHKGKQHLTDPRDIYELIANNASRRVRACILSIVPGDIVEAAVNECNKTLSGSNSQPLKDRLTSAFTTFKEKFDVTQDQIELYFGYKSSEFSESNFQKLISIYNSLNDGESKVKEWFEPRLATADDSSSNQKVSTFAVEDKPKKSEGVKSNAKDTKSKPKSTKTENPADPTKLL